MKNKIRLGIIGVGNMGTTHIKNILAGKCPEITVSAVADINPSRLLWAKENLPEAVRFESPQDLYKSGVCDAVLIATPHYDHPDLSISAFRHGLHVMCEKPAGVYTKNVRTMNEEAEKSGLIFGVMFCLRTDPIFRKMKELVSQGELGKIRRINWIVTSWYRSQAYYDSGDWRATWSGEGGGVLLNQCPHNLDLLQWICGMPRTVDAHLYYGKWHDIEVEDDVTAFLEFDNGATGTFITSTGDAPGSNRFEITFDKGKLISENGKLKLWKLEQSEQEFSAINKVSFGMPQWEETEIRTEGTPGMHPEVLNAFAGAILRGEPLTADGSQGINGLIISNAIHLSDWLKKPVHLPLDEELFYSELKKRIALSRRKSVSSITAAEDISNSYTSSSATV